MEKKKSAIRAYRGKIYIAGEDGWFYFNDFVFSALANLRLFIDSQFISNNWRSS